ncbi:MAG: AI-2E family transporter [Bacteroidota bacterium]|nr:AI-2E family transporter [Bacteroidota bacterium]MXW14657.1 AI-2E family transporter [Rhodothermaceae bacterium]MDE2645711.1 AI-2E family transporter [Bacteroidota bacterium]MXW33983.1 AI-2E family transporter [Rhodothermaceae bacterium]MXZ18589.1 AI-2E family transporter [Rhodothermaceae bacterium]
MTSPGANFSNFKPQGIVYFLLGLIAAFVVGVTLLELRSVLVPFSVALLLSFIFQPIVLYLKARRIPMVIALVVVFVVLAAAATIVGYIVYSSAQSLATAADRYLPRIQTVIADIEALLQSAAAVMGLEEGRLDLSQVIDPSIVSTLLQSGIGEAFTFAGNTFLVLLFMLFILAGSGELVVKVRRAYPESIAARIASVTDNISQQVRQYLVAKTLVSVGTGLLIFLVLWLLGVDYAIFWGFLAFILNYIPNIGSFVAVILPFGFALLQFDTLTIPIIAALLMWLIQMVMGNVVDPRLMAFSLNLSPLLVIVSLIFWGWLWGIAGMILAVPLTATIKIFFENIDSLRPIAVLMGSVNGASDSPEEP